MTDTVVYGVPATATEMVSPTLYESEFVWIKRESNAAARGAESITKTMKDNKNAALIFDLLLIFLEELLIFTLFHVIRGNES